MYVHGLEWKVFIKVPYLDHGSVVISPSTLFDDKNVIALDDLKLTFIKRDKTCALLVIPSYSSPVVRFFQETFLKFELMQPLNEQNFINNYFDDEN